ALDAEHLPVIVFVTAHDHYALRAFEVHALDYLLKPFDRERFQKALERARSQIRRNQNAEVNQRLLAFLEDVKGAQQPSRDEGKETRKSAERLVIKSGGKVFFVRLEEIDWIEAAGNYVRLRVGKEAHLFRETMNGMEARLDPEQFLRI